MTFKCPKCGGTEYKESHDAAGEEIYCTARKCNWYGTWSDIAHAREHADGGGVSPAAELRERLLRAYYGRDDALFDQALLALTDNDCGLSHAEVVAATQSMKQAKEEIRKLKSSLTAANADAAAMREVFGEVIDWQGIDHEDEDCPEDDTCECALVARVNAVFKATAGAALLAELEGLREFAKSHEAWEANLIMSQAAWGDSFPKLDAKLFDEAMHVQAKRNAALKHTPNAESEST